jgi:hypothetical protein
MDDSQATPETSARALLDPAARVMGVKTLIERKRFVADETIPTPGSEPNHGNETEEASGEPVDSPVDQVTAMTGLKRSFRHTTC